MNENLEKRFQDDRKIVTIIDVVSTFYGVNPTEIFENTRKLKFRKPRQIIHYLVKLNTKKSLSDIGKISIIYGREKQHDHASVLHSCKVVNDYLDTDSVFREEIKDINIIIRSRTNSTTKLDIDHFEKKQIQQYYEDLLLEKENQIKILNSTIEIVKKNISTSTNNNHIKQLLIMDDKIISMFCDTRLKPFLRMMESRVTNEDLIRKQHETRS